MRSTTRRPYEFIENRAFHELSIGDGESHPRCVTYHDINPLATVTGGVNPAPSRWRGLSFRPSSRWLRRHLLAACAMGVLMARPGVPA